MAYDPKKSSKLYFYVRINAVDNVKRTLRWTTIDDINRIEPNRSTALHAACYYGYKDIVELLINAKANRSIINGYGNTPLQEAATNEIRCLLECPTPQESKVDWLIIDDTNLVKNAIKYRSTLKKLSYDIRDSIPTIITKYLDKDLQNIAGIEKIKQLFIEADRNNNPKSIIEAYTLDTEFCHQLNRDLAATSRDVLNVKWFAYNDPFLKFWTTHGCLAGIIAQHSKLKEYRFFGKSCYRGMKLSQNDLELYKVNDKPIMTKSFLSTSKSKTIATEFALNDDYNISNHKYPIVCTYKVLNKHTALDIENLSVFKSEKEVLIAPYTVFKVKSCTEVEFTSGKIGYEMELEECI